MPLSAVIELEALEDARLDSFTGRGVHGFWFGHWHNVDPAYGDALHASSQEAPFTLSPLMFLSPGKGRGESSRAGDGKFVKAGEKAWFRFTTLTDDLTKASRSKWLAGLKIGSRIEVPSERKVGDQVIPGAGWKVTGAVESSGAHPLAGEAGFEELSRRHLMNPNPPRQWRLDFLTPTTFNSGRTSSGKDNHLPFPLPESLVGSWLRRWQAFSPLALPKEEIAQWARANLVVSSFRLNTAPAREGERLRVGCMGWLTLRALDMPPYLRAAVDLLAAFAFYCGSGAHTAQGLGQTRCASRA